MDRSQDAQSNSILTRVALLLALLAVVPSTGCLHQILATGIYIWDGGNLVDADTEALNDQRVVVFCRPPSSSEYRHAGASRQLADMVSSLLMTNVPGVDMVDPNEVDEWLDENDSDDFKQLGRAMKADRVVQIELDHFELYNGKTLYQGNADVKVTVYDMTDNAKKIWDREMGEVLFPRNSSIPAQDKPIRQFQREFVSILADDIARSFYRHDPHADFAIDAKANR